MSETDSFIEEVSEEVRRDRLFRLMRKYGWIPISLIVLLVGSSAYIEWSKARAQNAAEVFGLEILNAIQVSDESERVSAIGALSGEGDAAALIGFLTSSNAILADDRDAAISALQAVTGSTRLSAAYRDLAELKLLLIQSDDLPRQERLDRLQAIAAPGAPYRLLAEEQMALSDVATGNDASAIERLNAILTDDGVTQGLRLRAQQLIVALGGELAPV